MKILIADDHAVVRTGLKQILSDEFADISFGEAQSAEEAVQSVQKQDWDLVLMDIAMPGRSGLDALLELKKLKPRLPVLVLSMFPEAEYAVRAFKSGAAGYVTKDSASDELVAAVRKVIEGGRYVSAALAEKLATDVGKGIEVAPHERLSNREMQIMRMLAMGKTVKEIASDMSLSPKTVGTYRSRIMEKTGLRSNVDIARYALQNKLV